MKRKHCERCLKSTWRRVFSPRDHECPACGRIHFSALICRVCWRREHGKRWRFFRLLQALGLY